jgi:hypothetical protein
MTTSDKVHSNWFILRLKGCLVWHQSNSISYFRIVLIDDYRDESVGHIKRELCTWKCQSWRLVGDFFDTHPTCGKDAPMSINGHIPWIKCSYWKLGCVNEIQASHIDLHCRQELKSQLYSKQLNGIIYVTDSLSSVLQRLRKLYQALYKITVVEKGSQIMWQLWMRSTITLECSKVAGKYDSRVLLLFITCGTSIQFQETYTNEWIMICTHTMAFREGFGDCNGDVHLLPGLWGSAGLPDGQSGHSQQTNGFQMYWASTKRFNWCVISLRGNE